MPTHVAAHRLIAFTAEQFAQAIYEELAKDNEWYARHRGRQARRAFIKEVAPGLVSDVTNHFVDMLAMPHISDTDKHLMFEALRLQACLPKGGTSYVN